MKTAEEILNEAYLVIKFNQDSSHTAIDPVLLNAMKEYAQQVAEQALKDASYKVTIKRIQETILSTKIQLP